MTLVPLDVAVLMAGAALSAWFPYVKSLTPLLQTVRVRAERTHSPGFAEFYRVKAAGTFDRRLIDSLIVIDGAITMIRGDGIAAAMWCAYRERTA